MDVESGGSPRRATLSERSMKQIRFFDDDDRDEAPERNARRSDPETSHAGARSIAFRAGSQCHRLLEAYAAHPAGLSTEQAGEYSGLSAVRGCGYWKRVSDLHRDGLIEDTGETREASTGESQCVRRITLAGMELVRAFDRKAS